MLRLLKPFSFIPALIMMYMIFSFSGQDGGTSSALSYKVSYIIVESGAKILGKNPDPSKIEHYANRIQLPIRKTAHMTEYFILALAVSFPLYVYGLRGLILMIAAGGFCFAFSCGDEYHQSFISGRVASVLDVAIDSFGVFWGVLFVRFIQWITRKQGKLLQLEEPEFIPDPPRTDYYTSDRLSDDLLPRNLIYNIKEKKRKKNL